MWKIEKLIWKSFEDFEKYTIKLYEHLEKWKL